MVCRHKDEKESACRESEFEWRLGGEEEKTSFRRRLDGEEEKTSFRRRLDGEEEKTSFEEDVRWRGRENEF